MKTPDLKECREKLDGIDREIVRLFEERMVVCGQVAEYKIETGKAVYDGEREKQKLAAVREMAAGDQNKEAVEELFTQLMTMSRRYQYSLLCARKKTPPLGFTEVEEIRKKDVRVVFQGVEGAYSHAAVRMYFGEDADAYHVEKFEDTIRELERGQADYAVLPIENSTAGAVNEIYDLLVEFENYIVGETIIPIKNTLSGLPGTDISEIERVYSKAEALMQASHFLGDHGDWQQISVANTALAAKKILEDQDKRHAAVCSAYAASVYGLSVLADNINDEKNNSTRFIVITNQKVFLKDATKISICLELPHESSSLYHLLSHFAYNDLNMTKIESRPMEGKSWEYRFFIDFEGNLADPAVKNAIRGLREESRNLRILGNY